MGHKKYRAVVTGATRGIGYAIAEKLIQDGLEIIATGTDANGTCPAEANYCPVDFLNNESLDSFAEYLKSERIDVLINNAGINKIGEFASTSIVDFDKIMQVNLRAPFILCQAVIPYMKENNWGRIVNITSIFGAITKEFRAPYSSSKFGLDGMTAALSAELSQYGILANCVGPGFIDTELTRNVLSQQGIIDIKDRIPMKRLGYTEEVARLVSWIASKENTYMTGQNLMVDGGFSRV